jgi:hypothetical protein
MSSDIELSRTRLVVIISVAAWFLAALGAYLPGLLQTGPSSPPIPIGLALLAPLLLGGLAYARSARFQRLLLNIDLRWLIGVQRWRVVGAVFLLRYARHELPASFTSRPGSVTSLLASPHLLFTAALAVQRPPKDHQRYHRDDSEPYGQRDRPKPDHEYPCDERTEGHCDGCNPGM